MRDTTDNRSTQVESFFDANAPSYDRAYGDRGAAGRVLRKRAAAVLELLGDKPGDVLDAGMGGGWLCAELDRRGWVVTGIDSSPRMVELARARLPSARERLLEASIERLPFADAVFDATVATGVLEYVDHNLPGALAELARVLRPGGTAVISFPNYHSPHVIWRVRVLYPTVRRVKRLLGRQGPPRRRSVSFEELTAAVAGAGLELERVERSGVRPASAALAERLERSRSSLLMLLAVQIVLRARKQEP
jgi:SAM-dependent methyltransferase